MKSPAPPPAPPLPGRRCTRRSLKLPIVLLLGVSLLTMLLVISAATLFILWPGYQQIEQEEAERDLMRLDNALQHDLNTLSLVAIDWANWDDTYHYMQDRSEIYLQSNMLPEGFRNAKIDNILLLDLQLQPVWSGQLDDENNQLTESHPDLLQNLQQAMGTQERGNGLILAGAEVHLFAWEGIRDSQGSKPADGMLVMTRRLDAAYLKRLARQLDLQQLQMLITPSEATASFSTRVQDVRLRHNTLTLPLLGTVYGLQLQFDTPREITRLASDSLRTGGLLTLAGAVTCMLLLYFQLHRYISQPLARLAETVVRLGEHPGNLHGLEHLSGRLDEIGTLASEIRQMHLRILSLSNHDPLTGLPNRRQFDQVLNERLLSAGPRYPFCLCFIDLDGFKPVNDQFGHKTGDHLLQLLALRLGSALREQDHLARIGGDEFVLTLDGVSSREQATPILERLLHEIRQIKRVDEHTVEIDASIGVACYPVDAQNIPSLLQRADQAMYHSKQQGGGRITFAADVPCSEILDVHWQEKRRLYSRPLDLPADQEV